MATIDRPMARPEGGGMEKLSSNYTAVIGKVDKSGVNSF